jgi:cellulose biosynthesis protein BcsQ
MLVLTLASGKGGTCRSTLASCLAVEAAKTMRVGLIDASNDQATLTRWHQGRAANGHGAFGNPALIAGKGNVDRIVRRLRAERAYDLVIADASPTDLELIVLVPVRVGGADLSGAEEIVLTCASEAFRRPFAFVLTAVDRQRFKALIDFARKRIHEMGADTLRAEMLYRVAYVTALHRGLGAQEYDKEAAKDIAAIWNEVRHWIVESGGHV